MVLPLVDESKLKCYLCHLGFESIEKLRDHQNTVHREFFESHEKINKREPVQGDVTVF